MIRRGEKCVHGFDGETRKKETALRSKFRQQDNIKVCVTETGYEDVDRILLT
jgi:hypothetical protein